MNKACCISLIAALACAYGSRAQGVVINELQCAGTGPDRVELLNTQRAPVDVSGLRFGLNERIAQVEEHMVLRRGERCVIAFGGEPVEGTLHIGFGLPRSGGTLLLLSADGLAILDVFTWPAMPADVSIGRQPDGAAGWSFFPASTFGAANSAAPPLRRVCAMPQADPLGGVVVPGSRITLSAEAHCAIRYTLDGSIPSPDNGFGYTGPLIVDHNTVIKARAFADAALPSPTYTATYLTPPQGAPWIAVNGAPTDGWDGASTTATVELFGIGTPGAHEVKLRESGSGSRSYPKRNLKLDARGNAILPWPDSREGDEAILRADATPYAFLRNRFMECAAQQAGSHVDVQASLPVDLYLNGSYHGLYRWMPPKDDDWLRTVHGHEAMDVLHGPSLRKVDGDRKHFHEAYEALLTDAPMDTLERLIDVPSLMDLACFDLWTGRADHDLNVRCWRPKVPGGTWRWILYDMDLWAPADDNSLARMCNEPVPVAPYIPQLLHTPTTRDRLLARMSALLATVLAPAHAHALADSLYQAHAPALLRDHTRWSSEMAIPSPLEARDALLAFTDQRPRFVLEHLSLRTGLGLRTMTIASSPAAGGSVQLEDLPLPALPTKVTAFAGVTLHLRAMPAEGYEFVAWKQVEGGDAITVDPRKSHKLTAVFRRTGTSSHHGLKQPCEEGLAIGIP